MRRIHCREKSGVNMQANAGGTLAGSLRLVRRGFFVRGRMGGMDENPYKSPSEPVAMTTGKVVKRGLGVGAILLLTPVAIAIAFGASCTAVVAYMDATFLSVEGSTRGWINAWVISAWFIFLLPPVATLAGMIWWAVRVHRRGKRNPSES